MAKDIAEKAHKNWKVKGLLGYDKQFGLYYECFEKPLKSFNQGSTVFIYIYTNIYVYLFNKFFDRSKTGNRFNRTLLQFT